MSQLRCRTEQRRQLVREREGWNGLDFVEVSDDQRELRVYFLGKAPAVITAANVLILGGRRITDIQVTGIEIERDTNPDSDDYMRVFVDKYGDFSPYQLVLAELDSATGRPVYDDQGTGREPRPLAGFDPRYYRVAFSFKAGCPSDLDCRPPPACAPEPRPTPDINYLAKDYTSFRQLILDRLALTMPHWRERHVPDLGIALVELLAYVGDHLSYYQDAVATEAYLDTARRRVSVRRHARLVDYQLHEGCNARALVALEVDGDYPDLVADDFYLITASAGSQSNSYPTALTAQQLAQSLNSQSLNSQSLNSQPFNAHSVNPLVFEPLVSDPTQKIPLYLAHNAIRFYTWGDSQCCIAKGATSATLVDPGVASPPEAEPNDSCQIDNAPTPTSTPNAGDYKLQLRPCDLLIIEEVKGPATGHPGDADPNHRQAVRLTRAERGQDQLTGQLIWEVEWAGEDALEFSLCLSAINREDCAPIEDVSLVRGNLVLVDHGRREEEELPPVPGKLQQPDCTDHCLPPIPQWVPKRYQANLRAGDLSFSQPLPPCKRRHCNHTHVTPARELLVQDPRAALPVITLADTRNAVWTPKLDLLACDSDDRHFVVEVEEDRHVQLRFGNGDGGRLPLPDTRFSARYRVGNGNRGNVGADAISHIVFRNSLPNGLGIVRVRNPLPASGGTDPEPMGEAKLYAPQAFQKVRKRAITPADYVAIVERDFASRVQRAAAQLHWTGSRYEMWIAIDPLTSSRSIYPDTDTHTNNADPDLLTEIHCHLRRYRRIGHDLVVDYARYVPVDLALQVCVQPGYVRGQVKAVLLDAFSERRLTAAPGGITTGFFHPDNLSFGTGVQLSELVARAQSVEGVMAVTALRLERQFEGPNGELENGILPLGPFEIALLRQDPNYPEQGKFTVNMRGGR